MWLLSEGAQEAGIESGGNAKEAEADEEATGDEVAADVNENVDVASLRDGEDDSADPQAVRLPDGTGLPVWKLKRPLALPPPSRSVESPSVFVFGHGLLGNATCVTPMLEESLQSLAKQERRIHSAPLFFAYDARGHGQSSGWVGGGVQQFHWRALAVDMLEVAAAAVSSGSPAPSGGFILGGQSMGANTALWAALLSPRAVKGLALMQVTTAWQFRSDRKADLDRKAERAERRGEDGRSAVLRGASLCELPAREDLRAIRVPTLIVASRDDRTHPSMMANEVAELLPQAKLVLVENRRDIQRVFSRELAEWLVKHFS